MNTEEFKEVLEKSLGKLDLKEVLTEIGRYYYVFSPYEPERNEKGEVLGFLGDPV